MGQQTVSCGGGLNTEAALYDMQAGEAVALLNVEVDSSGTYTTMAGIERFDGRAEPNKGVYKMLRLGSATGIVLGATITATPSGWTGVIVGIDGNNIGVIKTTGTATTSDTIAGNTVVTAPVAIEARTYELHRQFRAFAQVILRAPIGVVPGVGYVRGVVIYKGSTYAFRDHADGTTCRMYRASAGGWVEVTTGGFLLKNGRYDFRIHNFLASASSQLLIVVNGVNKAVKFDGTTCAQLSTGMVVDTPSSVEVLPSSVLLLGYDNGSVMTSKIGDPTDFTVGSGGTELGMSDKVVSMALQPDGKVAIFCEKQIKILAGKTLATFDLSTFNDSVGAVKGSVASIGDSIFLSQSGLTRLSRTQTYGSFEMSGMDQKIKSLITNSEVVFSIAVRRKNQYRLFNLAGFIGITVSGQDVIGAFTGTYPVQMHCGYSGEIAGEEYVFLGGEDGHLYRADVGQSHAGAQFSRLARLAWNDCGSSNYRKKFKRLYINADSERLVTAKIGVDIDYSSGESPRQNPFAILSGGNEAYYGSAVYGKSAYGKADSAINQIYLSGVGRSIAVSLLLNSDSFDPIRFGGYTIQYENRAMVR